jgi:deoxyribonucleoside regulator
VDSHSEILKLVEVAKMYYEQELNQSEIAKTLGVSRPLVSKMLQRCKVLGIVNIEIRSPLEGNEGLLNKMKMKFDLLDGLIVPANRNNLNLSMKNFISQASIFLERRLSDQVSIGLGWGSVLADLVDVFSAGELNTEKSITVCPLIGSMSSPSKGFHPNELSRRFAEKIQGEALYLHAPAFPGNKKNFEVFQQTDEYKSIGAVWQKLDTAIISIGTYPSVPDQATAIRFGKTLKEKHAVGMLLSNFYDVNGNMIEGENDYAIRIPLDYLRKVKKVILVCSGNMRANSILGALKTGLITHLVTDDFAAKSVLELESDLSE